MRKNHKLTKGIIGICLFLVWTGVAGCGAKESITLAPENEKAEQTAVEEQTDKEQESRSVSGEEEPEAEEGEKSQETPEKRDVSIYVCGAVNAPGVYALPAGSRLYQAIDAAGGMREDADRNYLNLAMELTDGEKVQVPTREEVEKGLAETAGTAASSGGASQSQEEGTSSGLININQASEAQLMTLTGIGEAKAKSIVAYREEQGGFSKIEDIMKISGIKESVFEKIKDQICVK